MLSQQAIELASGVNFGIVSTLLPSGLIQTQPIWVDTDGEHILLNTEVHRRKFGNVEANPTITVTILRTGDPWSWSEVRGKVIGTQRGPEARAHIDKMAKKYFGKDEYPNPIQSERVILKVAPERVFDFPPGQ